MRALKRSKDMPSEEKAPALQIQNVTKTFGKKTAVDKVSFDLFPGEVFGFLGPNGAGKTTIIKMVMGFVRPDEGTIIINGRRITNRPCPPLEASWKTRKCMNLFPQDSIFRCTPDFIMASLKRGSTKSLSSSVFQNVPMMPLKSTLSA